jgi:hypothetical protein
MSHHGGTETRRGDGEEETRMGEKTEERGRERKRERMTEDERGRGESGERVEESLENDDVGDGVGRSDQRTFRRMPCLRMGTLKFSRRPTRRPDSLR